jgi:hypothetical protein
MCKHSERMLKHLQERHEWLWVENEGLKATTTKSESIMEKKIVTTRQTWI